jgi:N-acetylneuraminate synthase
VTETKIGHRNIGPDHAPFVVAEMSGNHNQSLERALEIVDAAAKAGAHGLKIQTYTAETMTLDLNERDFRISESDSLWKDRSLYDLYEEAHTPWEWHKPIFDRCHERGIIGFSTPFDATSVDFLESLNVPCYKIASFENTDVPLLKKVAQTRKPIIMSTGMATLAELDESVRVLKSAGCKDLILLKCTSSYPSSPVDSNIRSIPALRDIFGVQVGLSDHTMGVGVSVASVALGATFIEKHFTLSRAEGGVDTALSLEPQELEQLVIESERAWQGLGKIQLEPTENEAASIQFRRSLYIAKDLKAGDVLTAENVRAIRPGFGLPPKYLEVLLGKTVSRDVARGTATSWDLIE